MHDILINIEQSTKHIGLNYEYGYLKQFSERLDNLNYPILWLLPLQGSMTLDDDNPDPYATLTATGLILTDKNIDNIKDKDNVEAFEWYNRLITDFNFNTNYELSSITFEPIPESVADRAYGLRFSFDISFYTSIIC